MATLAEHQTVAEGRAIRWGRVIVAGIASEVSVVVLLLAIQAVYMLIVAPGGSAAQYQEFSQNAGYDVAPWAGAITTLLLAMWVCRPLTRAVLLNATLVGVVSTSLSIGFIFSA